MDLFGIGTAVSGIANAASSAITSRKNLKDQQRFEIEQRDYMNQYNSPVMQMQRYKEAGLNPHLIYGKGGSAGNQTQKPTVDFSQRKPIEFPNLIGMYQQSRINEGIINNANADIAVKNSVKEKNQADAKAAMAQAGLTDYNKEFLTKTEQERINKISAEVSDINAAISLKAQQTDNEKIRSRLIEAQAALEEWWFDTGKEYGTKDNYFKAMAFDDLFPKDAKRRNSPRAKWAASQIGVEAVRTVAQVLTIAGGLYGITRGKSQRSIGFKQKGKGGTVSRIGRALGLKK